MKRSITAKTPKQALTHSKQANLSAWKASGLQTTGCKNGQKLTRDEQQTASDNSDHRQDPLEEALTYLKKAKDRTPPKNEVLQKHLVAMEKIAQERGLAPEQLDILLNIALSGKFAEAVSTRLLKNLVPTSAIMEDSVISAVSWLCVGKCSRTTQVVFLKWLIAMFDFIDQKEQMNALYGFFFNFLQDEKLFPFACHVLYLLTRKKNVKPFRVRRLLDLQAKIGAEPPLQALLSLYKNFCPEMVSVTLSTNTKIQFRNSENLWKMAISNLKRRLYGAPLTSQPNLIDSAWPQSRKRKWNARLVLPVSSAHSSCSPRNQKTSLIDLTGQGDTFPVEQLQTFSQLLENIHCLELPSRIGSVLANPLLLHYVNCVSDDSVYRRMYYWMGQTLREECPWHKVENQLFEKEFKDFLRKIFEAECFLQEGFSSCEEFLYRSLPFWDGCSCRPEVLQLVSWIPLSTFSEMKLYLFKPLAQLFFTSSLYFKCSVLECLRELLLNWLNWHIMQTDTTTKSTADLLNTTLSGLVSSVADLISFVGWLSTIALRLENNSAFLMHFILDFYEIVSDVYLMYNLPLVLMPPAGVFYTALLSMDSVNLDHLCYIMYRYRTNLIAAKQKQQSKKTVLQFKFSSKTCQEYNKYLLAMVGCLWTSNVFRKDFHHQGIRMDPEVLERTGMKEYRRGFSIVYHPALTGYAMLFLQEAQPENRTPNFQLIQGRMWDWYLEYLYTQELQGLKVFIESSVQRASQSSQAELSK
ncbi:centromere protein I [Heteronotia binoei]|uniref:centromere protein I n=1 Tax=Heteronotia binoei TaxID=13085 RepID=UPI00293066F7|nr:centromere protein I [Heteronotia binoei]